MKIFNIKGVDVEVITLSSGLRCLAPEGAKKLLELTLKYGDELRNDKDALLLANYLKG